MLSLRQGGSVSSLVFPSLNRQLFHGPCVASALVGFLAKCFVCDRVPQIDGRLVDAIVVITEDAERCGAEQKMLRLVDGQPNPPGGKDAAKVAVGEECNISSQQAEAGN